MSAGLTPFVVQPTGPPVNDSSMVLTLVADAAKAAGAIRVTAVVAVEAVFRRRVARFDLDQADVQEGGPRARKRERARDVYHPQGVAGIHVEATAGRPGERVEVWFEDEARFGQKGSLTTVWAERGSRPTAPEQTAYGNLHVGTAVCPATGRAEGRSEPF